MNAQRKALELSTLQPYLLLGGVLSVLVSQAIGANDPKLAVISDQHRLVTSTTKTHPPTEHSVGRFYYLTTFPRKQQFYSILPN